MFVGLGQRLTFPPEIVLTNLHPDLLLWSSSWLCAFIIKQTVSLEGGIDKAHENKRLRYANLAAEADEWGWDVRMCPVAVGCRDFIASSTTRLLKVMGIRGQTQQKAIKELATVAEKSSHWLANAKKKETAWATKWPQATHTQVWSACCGPASGVLWLKGWNTQWVQGTQLMMCRIGGT